MFDRVANGWRAGLFCVAGVALLLLAFWLGRTTASPGTGPAPTSTASRAEAGERGASAADDRVELEALRAELQEEREHAYELAAQLEWVLGQFAQVGREVAPEGGPEAPASPADDDQESTPPSRWFDAQLLLDAGVHEAEVSRLKDLFAAYEMERIELQHRAEREGWLNKRRFWNEMLEFQLGMRDEVGDESYDLMLYATGRKNRVVMNELLEGSPAQGYGFQPGDVVIAYDGTRIFHGRELRHATASGERGEWVIVDVRRGDETVRVRAQRGPLGAKLRHARVAPGEQR